MLPNVEMYFPHLPTHSLTYSLTFSLTRWFFQFSSQQYQLEALGFYFCGFLCFTAASLLYLGYLYGLMLDNLSYGQIATIIASIGLFAFFIGMERVIEEMLLIASKRMGADRPKALVRGPSGGWELDEAELFEQYTLLGEVDVLVGDRTNSQSSYFDNRMCGCCQSTFEMALWSSGTKQKQTGGLFGRGDGEGEDSDNSKVSPSASIDEENGAGAGAGVSQRVAQGRPEVIRRG